MNKVMTFSFSMLIVFALAALPVALVEAASPSNLVTLKLRVEVPEKNFWNCTFLTPESDQPSKPSLIKAEWNFDSLGKNVKSEVIVANGKKSGEIMIISEKGSVVNLDVFVKDAKNVTLGYWGMQLLNKGQTETLEITLPQEIRPQFTRSNI